jgi:hypothetical protein
VIGGEHPEADIECHRKGEIMTRKRKKQQPKDRQLGMFEDHETLPLFSGTPMRAVDDPFVAQPASSQGYLPGMRPGWDDAASSDEESTTPLLFEIEEARKEGTSSPIEDAAREGEE